MRGLKNKMIFFGLARGLRSGLDLIMAFSDSPWPSKRSEKYLFLGFENLQAEYVGYIAGLGEKAYDKRRMCLKLG